MFIRILNHWRAMCYAVLAWLLTTGAVCQCASSGGAGTTSAAARGTSGTSSTTMTANSDMSSGDAESVGSGSGRGLVTQSATGSEGEEGEYCLGYRQGNPGLLPEQTPECVSGARIGVVDHMKAFGIGSHVISPNWTACGIPVLPSENERVCYKTTVLQCPDSYQVYLNLRNPDTLATSCPNETNSVPQSQLGGLFLQSPRYMCSSRENNFFKYRKSEFCLYKLSLPECLSGKVVIDNDLHMTQEMERRQRYHICSDYLQFFTENSASKRYCDSELARIKLEIPSTQLTALFWTDTSYNKLGFKLHVSCLEEDP